MPTPQHSLFAAFFLVFAAAGALAAPPSAGQAADPGDAAGRARLADESWKRAEAASEAQRGALFEQAEYWYRKALPGLSGLPRAKAVQRLAVIRSRLHGPVPAAKAPGAWVDVIAQLRADRDMLSGECRIADGRLECQSASSGNPRVAFPLAPASAYELQLRFLRKADGAIGIVLPVGEKLCVLAINIGEGVHGIDMVDGRRAADNASTVKAALSLNRPYQLEISVRVDGAQAAITTTLDGRPWIYYRGPLAALSLHGDWQYRKRAPGLIVQSTAMFDAVRIRN